MARAASYSSLAFKARACEPNQNLSLVQKCSTMVSNLECVTSGGIVGQGHQLSGGLERPRCGRNNSKRASQPTQRSLPTGCDFFRILLQHCDRFVNAGINFE